MLRYERLLLFDLKILIISLLKIYLTNNLLQNNQKL
jgi:hypothetical protein